MDERKKVGPLLATLLVAGCMIGSGIFMLPASMGALGAITIFSWIAATAGALLIGGSLAFLAALSKDSGGGLFVYLAEAFGPGAGFVAGVLYWASALVGTVAISIATTGYIGFFVPLVRTPPGSTVCTVLVMWLLIAVNAAGPRIVAQLQGLTLAIGLIPVLLAAILGWFFFHPDIFAASWNPAGATGLAIVPRGAVMAFWAFIGMEGAVLIAARVRNPRHDVPIATVCGISLAGLVYIAACSAIMGILPSSVLAHSTAPFADAATPVIGAWAAAAVALCAIWKTLGTLGGNLLLVAESAESESVLGRIRKKPSHAGKASYPTLLCMAVLGALVAIFSTSPTLVRQFTIVTDVVVVLSMLVYGAGCVALFRLANALALGRRIFAWAVAAGGSLFCMGIVAASEPDLLIWSAAAVAAALAVFAFVTWRRRARPAAAVAG